MSRLRSSMILLGICVAALLVGVLHLLTERTTLPIGSSYSAQPDGALALYEWTAALGASPSRLQTDVVHQPPGGTPPTVLVLQPETPVTRSFGATLDSVPDKGGTL